MLSAKPETPTDTHGGGGGRRAEREAGWPYRGHRRARVPTGACGVE